MARFSSTILLLALGLMLLGLAACSSEESPQTPAQPPTTAAQVNPASGSSPTPQPAPAMVPAQPPAQYQAQTDANGNPVRRGGNLVLASMADVPHRDVHLDNQETLATLGPGLAYSRLLRLSTGPDIEQPSLLLECDLCESWELAPDLSYVFRLRPDVRWQNAAPVSGRQLVADDLVFSYQRMRTPGWPGAARFDDRGIGDITAVDDLTLKVNLEFRDSDALLALADGHSKIVAPEVVEQYGDLKRAPVIGTGPWVYEQTLPGIGADFTRNPAYFEPGRPYLDGITVKAVKTPGVAASVNPKRMALFESGQIDVLVVPPTDWVHLERSKAEFNSRISQQPEIGMTLFLNTGAYPLGNLAVRRAIFRAIDPWEYVDVDWSGQGGVGLGMPLHRADWQLERNEMRANYLASPSGARDILAENDIFYLPTVQITVADLGPDYRRIGFQVAQDLQAVGFDAEVAPVAPTMLQETVFGEAKDYQIALGPVPPHPTTNGYLYSVLHSGGPGNIVNHEDESLDALIEEQAAELDPARRQRLALDLQRHVLDQAYMFSPITGSYRWIFGWNLENFYPNTALSEYHYWAEAWLRR